MHATSTPTLAQPKNGAFAALGAAAILTAAIGFGAVIGMNLPTTATPTAGAGSATQIEAGLAAKQAGEAAASIGAGSALAIEQAFAAKSDDGANAVAPTLPFAIGGRDPQAGFNNAGIDSMTEYYAARAAAGWYPVVPVVDPLPYPLPTFSYDAGPAILYNVGPGLSSHDAARAANGWYGTAPVQDPANLSEYFSVRTPWAVLSYDQIRAMDGWKPFATVPQAPATDLGDIVPGLDSGARDLGSDGNADKVGTSHR
jgi:hypothetical protein